MRRVKLEGDKLAMVNRTKEEEIVAPMKYLMDGKMVC